MASTFLSRTPSVAGDRRTFTFSYWFKKATNGSTLVHFSNGNDLLTLNSNDNFIFDFNGASNGTFQFQNNKLRDNSAWYHLVVAIDTTQATDTDRLKLYLNGERITQSNTTNFPAQNYETNFNATQVHAIGRRQGNNDRYFDGCMAHFHFIDGTAYDASAFGQTDSTTGIWVPKISPSVTYGTNGFFLKFASSGSMGTDSSGNGNDFTVGAGNLTQTQDTPSNVFATINALQKTSSSQLLSNGNLEHRTTGNWMYLPATIGASSGKWYAEVKLTDATNFNVGVMQLGGASDTTSLMNTNNTIFGSNSAGDAWALFGSTSDTGTYKNNSTPDFGNLSTGFVGNWSNNDIAMIALDTDNQKIWFGRNGSWDNSGDPAAGTNPMPVNTSMIAGETYTFASGPEQGTQQWNFGNGYFGTTAVSSANSDGDGIGLFEYEVPSGYYALCTKNINTYG